MANNIHVAIVPSGSSITGSILRVQAIGPSPDSHFSGSVERSSPGTSSLDKLAFGDLKATSEITASSASTSKIDIPNGSVIEGPIHSLEVTAGDFLVTFKSQHIPVV